MPGHNAPRRSEPLNTRRVVLSGAGGAGFLALLGLAGWMTPWRRLGSLGADFIPMAPGTALGVLALAAALLLDVRWPSPRRTAGVAAVASLLGAFVLIATPGLSPRTRMSPLTGVGLVLVGLSACSAVVPPRRRGLRDAGGVLGLLAGVLALVILVGYAFGTPFLYGGPFIPMALSTAIALAGLSVAVVARTGPDRLPLRPLSGTSVQARLLRSFAPVALVVLLAYWVFLLVGFELNPALREALLALLVMAVVVGAAFRVARGVGRAVDRLSQALAAVRDVDQLIVREKDRARLLQEGSEILVRRGVADLAWVASAAGPGRLEISASAGLGGEGEALRALLGSGRGPECCHRALASGEMVRIDSPGASCSGCPSAGGPCRGTVLALPLRHEGATHGVLVTALAGGDSAGGEEARLLQELAEDIGHALHALDTDDERRRAEGALRARERRHRAILSALAEGVVIQAPDGRILDSNPSAERILGLTPDQMSGRTSLDPRWRAIHEDGAPFEGGTHPAMETLRTGQPQSDVVMGVHTPLGARRWISINSRLLADADGQSEGVVTSFFDITARKRAAEALEESERKYRHFFEQELAGHYVTTTEGRLLACNNAFARILGFASVVEAVGASMASRCPKAGQRSDFVARLRAEGRVDHVEGELLRKDGTTVQVIESAVGAFEGDPPRLSQIHGFLIDDTERRRAEAELRQAQKMNAVGRLASGVAHDFNNLLGVIVGYAALLERELERDDPRLEKLEQILKAADRAASLTRQLLAFSRKQVLKPRRLDLNDLVRDMAPMLRRLIGEDVRFDTVLAEGPCPVLADEGQMQQVLMNLVVNARDAMPQGGVMTIVTALATVDEAGPAAHPVSVAPGRHVALEVKDTGHGMDAETLSHIFEPFFTTKEADKGTGLGLATVYGVVKQSGGQIEVESQPAQGTTFRILLPMSEGPVERAPAPRERAAVAGGSETILVLEDDPGLRDMVREILEGAGYRVVVSARPSEALGAASTGPASIDLLLSDVVMPGMSGASVAARFLELQPGARVLYMSGYADEALSRHGALDAGIRLLQKPFPPEALLREVRAALEGASSTRPVGRRGNLA